MKILLLGSDRWEKFVIAAQRIGQTVIAVELRNAPTQVAHGFESHHARPAEALDRIVAKHQPDLSFQK
jgi:formate-dependent phosphoribosylglycinamide formyltransferase (GAR transformylase)